LVAGAIAACVPQDFWNGFFLTDHPVLATLWGPMVGPLVAIISFVCSVGNIPLAAVLWNGGISFGGVLAFILADLCPCSRRIVWRPLSYSPRICPVCCAKIPESFPLTSTRHLDSSF